MNRRIRWLTTLALWLLAAVAHAGTVTYVYTDPQGTPLAEADASGTITARFDYAPYGMASTANGMSGAPNGPGYTGHVNDPDTGLVYMQARYYDPGAGRFLSVDPEGPKVGNTFNFNRYSYSAGNPLKYTDPTGMKLKIVENFHAPRANSHSMADLVASSRSDSVAGPLIVAMEKSEHVNVLTPDPHRVGKTGTNPTDLSAATINADGRPSAGSDTVITISLQPESVNIETNSKQKMTVIPLLEKAVHEFKHAVMDNQGISPASYKEDPSQIDPDTNNPSVEQPPMDEENAWRKIHDMPGQRTSY